MPTKYDVFATIIEHAPCKARDLDFRTPVYMHLRSLISDGWVKKVNQSYSPIKNTITTAAFKIVQYCLKNGLNHNIFFSKNMPWVITEISKNAPQLRPRLLKANKENTEIMHYLEKNQFILLTRKKPREGILLKHQLLEQILTLNNIKHTLSTKYMNVENEVYSIKTNPLNPFDEKVFAFLSGSAQLEGSTITLGETINLLLHDIYPDKPKKDVQMVRNLNEAMYFVLEHSDKEITPGDIREMNKLVMFSLHRNAGEYKKADNKIQGNPAFKTAPPKEVPRLMQEYCMSLARIKNKKECLKNIGHIHNQLQRIHPFSDGNSRTTRMILNWVLLKHQIPLLVLKMGCFDVYINLTKLADRRDDIELTKLFHHVLLHESLL